MVEDLMECEQLCLHTHKSEVKYSTASMRLNCKRFVSSRPIGCWVSPASSSPPPFIMYISHLVDQPASPLLTFCTKKEKVAQLVVVQISQLLSRLQTIYLEYEQTRWKDSWVFWLETLHFNICWNMQVHSSHHAQIHNRIGIFQLGSFECKTINY